MRAAQRFISAGSRSCWATSAPEPPPRPGPGCVDAVDRRAMRGTPEEALIELQRSAVGIAVHEVDVGLLQIGRGQRRAPDDLLVEVRDVPLEARLDAIRVTLTQRLRPAPVPDVERPGGVALDAPGKLLQLDPEQPGSFGGT
jgi:hypothetical protein